MIINLFSRWDFIDFIERRIISDNTVEKFNGEFFISILPSGGPHSTPLFTESHPNVLTISFDDVESDGTKWGNDIQAYFDAKTMTSYQARELVTFIKKIPSESIVNIHCVYGSSRSGAVAQFLKDNFGAITNVDRDAINNHVLKLLNQELSQWPTT